MSAGTILKAALQYAARGWPVFPCKHDKRPLTSHGVKDATTDAAKINAWWTHWPGAAIGIDCGGARLLVVDCDVKHGVDGIAAFEALGIAHGEALHSRTPSGGLHILFSQNGTLLGSTAGRLAPGVDTRGAGGYIVAPPSHVDAGDYEPLDDWSREPAKVPAALSQLLAPPCPAPTPPAPTPPCPAPTPRGDPWATAALRDEAARLAATPPGARNAALNQAAFNLGQLVAAGYLSNAEVTDALTAAARACGLEADDGAREVAATIASGLRAGMTRPRYKPLRRARGIAIRESHTPQALEREREAPAQIPLATIQKALEENERGDADLLVQLTAGKWVFDHSEAQWYQFVGPGWRADSAGALYDIVNRDVAAQYLRLAADYRQRGDGEHERAALARAAALRSRRRADNVLFLAAHPTLAFQSQWDADPWLLGVANGVLDLHTGNLRPGRPEDW
ncbi:MAG TPA: bifunctional DNA primase/polymerase, partial [Anaerolineae bacterium]|nr:bifunctional DNA primase/polymerase [Anaerolineae bacterium]